MREMAQVLLCKKQKKLQKQTIMADTEN